jgi:excisionase family DNA binding protein
MNERLHDEKAARERLGGIGRSLFWELISSKELRSVKIGKRRLVPEQAICEYIARLERQADPATPAA